MESQVSDAHDKGVRWSGEDLERSREAQMRVKKTSDGMGRTLDGVARLRCA